MEGYDHKTIEQKWQKQWQDDGVHVTQDSVEGKDNFYTLVEFPYPSGNLHVGHWYAFAVMDIFVRYQRMLGKNVLFPIGFDAFGLPAENAAIKRGLNPRKWTYDNIAHMREQFALMGSSFDWSREVITADPTYYKWTQWLFLQFFRNGLAYQKNDEVNWCPSCKTVLANEQVIAGKCERCDSEVEKRTMKQWNLKITDYAERLIDDLEPLDWPEEIKHSQRNWIGRSEGAELTFALNNANKEVRVFTTRPDTLFGATYLVLAPEHALLDELKGEIQNWDEVEAYRREAGKKTEIERTAEGKEKTGVELKGITAVNPGSKEAIPIWVADYVLAHYGTGAIMAVPAHDERDFVFAKKYNLPIKAVVVPEQIQSEKDVFLRQELKKLIHAATDNQKLLILTGGYGIEATASVNFLRSHDDIDICVDYRDIEWWKDYFGAEGFSVERDIEGERNGKKKDFNFRFIAKKNTSIFGDIKIDAFGIGVDENNRLYDLEWGDVEYWEDFNKDDIIEVTFANLQTKSFTSRVHKFTKFERRPKDIVDFQAMGLEVYQGEGELVNSGDFTGMVTQEARTAITSAVGGEMKTTYKLRDWTISRQRYWGCPIPIIHCSACGAVPVPEEELPVELPEIDDYLPREDGKSPLAKAEEWVRVACPKCGADAERETDTFDTFIDSSWYFLRYTDSKNENEFASKENQAHWMPVNFYSGGAEHTTMHLLYSRFFHKALFDFGLVTESEPYTKRMNRGLILGPDGNKMSKSKGNVIDPDDVVEKLGADTVRMYLAFIGPYNEVGYYPWSPDGIVGVRRFLEKVWKQFVFDARFDSWSPSVENSQEVLLHKTIRDVTKSIQNLKLNTAVASLMKLVGTNGLNREKEEDTKRIREVFLKLLAPYAPHLAEELWHQLGHDTTIHLEPWPEYDEKLLVADEVTIAIQVNGKVRAELTVATDSSQEEVERGALGLEAVQKWLNGGKPKRIIYVPQKLLNIVV